MMSVVIPDEVLQATRMTEQELLQEIAVLLYQKEKLSLGQASKLVGLSLIQLQHLLSSRHVPLHYNTDDLEADLETLRQLGRL